MLLGKLLRIDVDPALHPNGGYGIPPDNPFVDEPLARAEIWAYGLRNPANFSFDRATGDLWIADVGQAVWEEINFEPATSEGGLNYGWSVMEGAHCFDPPMGCDPSGLTLPIAEYSHAGDEDCAVIGGSVYRGDGAPWVAGAYLLSDFCSGRVRSLRFGCDGWRLTVLHDPPFGVSTLGEDAAGEIYVAEWSTDASGVLYRLVGTPGSGIFSDGFESGDLGAWSTCAR